MELLCLTVCLARVPPAEALLGRVPMDMIALSLDQLLPIQCLWVVGVGCCLSHIHGHCTNISRFTSSDGDNNVMMVCIGIELYTVPSHL